jgi:hypothetical protein
MNKEQKKSERDVTRCGEEDRKAKRKRAHRVYMYIGCKAAGWAQRHVPGSTTHWLQCNFQWTTAAAARCITSDGGRRLGATTIIANVSNTSDKFCNKTSRKTKRNDRARFLRVGEQRIRDERTMMEIRNENCSLMLCAYRGISPRRPPCRRDNNAKTLCRGFNVKLKAFA